MSSESKTWWVPVVITLWLLLDFTVGFFVVLHRVFYAAGVPDAKAFSLLDIFTIFLTTTAGGTVGYWVGKTHGDKEKDKMIYQSMPAPTPSEPQKTITTTTSEAEAKT